MSVIKIIALSSSIIVLGWALFTAAWIFYHARQARAGSRVLVPYEQGGGAGRILVLGDSIAYGTGASRRETTLAGRVGMLFKDHQLINKAKNGKKTDGLAAEIEQDIDGRYDLILIVCGGNDIIRVTTDLEETGVNLAKIYSAASLQSDHVIALTTGDFRYTTLFPWPLNRYYSARSVRVRDLAQAGAYDLPNVTYVDMVTRNREVPFTHLKEASDRLHLSDDGVEYWLAAIKAAAPTVILSSYLSS